MRSARLSTIFNDAGTTFYHSLDFLNTNGKPGSM